MPYIFPAKDSEDVLDYLIDWSDWLGTDTISTSTWTVPLGITRNSDTNTTTTATVWLRGGTVGGSYQLTNTITTAGGRTGERSVVVRVKNR